MPVQQITAGLANNPTVELPLIPWDGHDQPQSPFRSARIQLAERKAARRAERAAGQSVTTRRF